MKILIAEDDATSRSMLTKVLSKRGFDVTTVPDGKHAWEALQKPDAPRLLILDWMMPDMDGINVCKKVRKLETSTPPYIIMLTSKTEKANLISGFEAGADDYLSKPFEPAELYARVDVGRRMVEIQERLSEQVTELQEALDHIKTLQGILPICSYCKNIRDDKGYWDKVEKYVGKHTGAKFSHSICPDCLKKQFPDIADECLEEMKGMPDAK